MSQGTGGSNPSLSANFISGQAVEKYPRGRRGSPAKGVGWDNCREGSNPSFSANFLPGFVKDSPVRAGLLLCFSALFTCVSGYFRYSCCFSFSAKACAASACLLSRLLRSRSKQPVDLALSTGCRRFASIFLHFYAIEAISLA